MISTIRSKSYPFAAFKAESAKKRELNTSSNRELKGYQEELKELEKYKNSPANKILDVLGAWYLMFLPKKYTLEYRIDELKNKINSCNANK